MLNTLLTSFSENLAVLVVLLLWFIWFQTRWHRDMTSLREEISNTKDDLRKEMSDMKDGLLQKIKGLADRMNEIETDLRKDMGAQGERLARIEGLLTRGAIYDAVAEPPPIVEATSDKDGDNPE